MAFKPIQALEKAALKYYIKNMAGANDLVTSSQDDRAVYKEWDTKAAVKDGFKASSYVYMSVSKKAESIGGVPWKVKRLKGDKWEVVDNHPLELLIEQPNPFMDRHIMMERLIQQLDLGGNHLLNKVRGARNVVAELWPIDPAYITPIASKQEFIAGYEYKNKEINKTYATEDIIHIMRVDPDNVFWGMGRLQAIAKTVDTDIQAVDWNKIALQNRAVTDGVLSFKETLNTKQYNEIRQQVREQKQGVRNARDMWIIGGGATWNQTSLSPVDMDFIEGRKMTREEITAGFGVPLILLGILEGSTYANYETARKAFWEDTIITDLNKIRAIFNQALVPEFQGNGETLYLDYDVSNVPALQENLKEKVDNAKVLWSMGVPFNQINERLELGFKDVEGGESGFIGSGLIPANLDFNTIAAQTIEETEDNEDDEPPKKTKGTAAAHTKDRQLMNVKGINLDSDEQKAIYWQLKERGRLAWYAKMTREAANLFVKEGKEIANAYENNGKRQALRKITNKDNKSKWAAYYLTNYKGLVKDFGEGAFKDLKSYMPGEIKAEEDVEEGINNFTFNPYDEDIQKYLTENAALKVVGVLDFTRQTIAAIIVDMEKDGANVDDIARAIRERYDTMSINRAFTIARTEVAAGSNYGLYSAGNQANDIIPGGIKKVWINSSDKRVRDSHDFKEIIGIDEKFQNGLLYPGDMENGSGKDVIKCRCTLAYRTN